MASECNSCRCGAVIRAAVFWRHVRKADGCWLWNGSKDNHGYGKQCHAKAHRLAWLFTRGEIPAGLGVLHKCDTPNCCNPDHLFLGTQADNMADMTAKGRRKTRGLKGEANPHAVLTDDAIRLIRKLHGPQRGKGVKRVPTQHQIAAQFGISRAAVCEVIRGGSWRHIQ